MTQWGLQYRDLPHCRARPWLPLQVIGEGGTHHASPRHPRPRGSSWQPCPCWEGRELLGRVGCLGERTWLTITLCRTKPLEHSWSATWSCHWLRRAVPALGTMDPLSHVLIPHEEGKHLPNIFGFCMSEPEGVQTPWCRLFLRQLRARPAAECVAHRGEQLSCLGSSSNYW